MNRRQALKLLGVVPLAGSAAFCAEDIERAAARVEALPDSPYTPVFFSDAEWKTVRLLADIIIPRDERSGSATDAKVPEFMDFIMNESSDNRKSSMRAGLAWLDTQSMSRFNAPFVDATDVQRKLILDEIAWPNRASDSLREQVGFFNNFRDLTALGFFSSKMGYDDLQYIGNQPMAEFPGCPAPALRKLGVSYDLMQARRA